MSIRMTRTRITRTANPINKPTESVPRPAEGGERARLAHPPEGPQHAHPPRHHDGKGKKPFGSANRHHGDTSLFFPTARYFSSCPRTPSTVIRSAGLRHRHLSEMRIAVCLLLGPG